MSPEGSKGRCRIRVKGVVLSIRVRSNSYTDSKASLIQYWPGKVVDGSPAAIIIITDIQYH